MKFYVASNNGSVLLSCMTMLALGLIKLHIRLDYLPPRATLITSSADHPKKTKSQVKICVSKKESTVSPVFNQKGIVPKLVTSEEQILAAYSDVFDGIGCFPGPHPIFKSIPVLHSSKALANQCQCISKSLSSKK